MAKTKATKAAAKAKATSKTKVPAKATSKTKAPAKAKATSKAKAKATKAPAKAKTTSKAKAKATKAPARTTSKTKTKAKAKAAKGSAKPTAVEKEVAALLDDYDNGQIDNAWDVLPRIGELDQKLPNTSSLRRDFDKMRDDLVEIVQSS